MKSKLGDILDIILCIFIILALTSQFAIVFGLTVVLPIWLILYLLGVI